MGRSKLNAILNILRGREAFFLEYPARPAPRYGYGKPPHHGLYKIINENRQVYEKTLNDLVKLEKYLLAIKLHPDRMNPQEPYWINGFLPILDLVSIYGFLSLYNPKNYIEVGAGFSTLFAREAIDDQKLLTTLTSIDPLRSPRTNVGNICDKHIAKPLEDIDLNEFDVLGENDILFIDGSHRSFMNSDVTVFFLDILPRLKPGVLVGIHDICLPYDYPPGYSIYYYSEQYLLASYLLAEGKKLEIILPAYFISHDNELFNLLKPLYSKLCLTSNKDTHGCSFWFKTR